MIKVQDITYEKSKERFLCEHTNIFNYLDVNNAIDTYVNRGAQIVSKSDYCCVMIHDQPDNFFDVIIVSQLTSKDERAD